MSDTINFDDFSRVDLRVGTIIEVHDFPEARNPAFKLVIDFGELGTRRSSAQITTLYNKDELLNKRVVAVLNFPEKKIADFKSECLILGAVDGRNVILLTPSDEVSNGSAVS